jgi:nucleotide-sensitive chloride channel 1A
MADGPEYDDEYDDEEAGWEEVEGGDEHGNDNNEDQQDGAGVNGGRVRSDFHSGGGPGARFAPY